MCRCAGAFATANALLPSGATVSNLVRILLAIFLPPVAVLMTNGIGLQFLLNVLLTIFFVLPGTIHALWLVLRER
jgi:uncharacterized membrane protein YqaE (UPF0057 family)